MANVLFKVGTRAQFDAIQPKSEVTLYWLTDTKELYKGDVLFGTGREASADAAGLLSAADYQKLQDLIVTGGTINLTPVDSSIVINEAENGVKSIGVAIAPNAGNALVAVEGGLFVKPVDLTSVENRLTAVEGGITQLQENIVGGIHYKGSVATKDDLPADAKQGDLYEVTGDGSEWCYNGEKWFEYGSTHFVPVAGNGIVIVDNVISVKTAESANGLVAVEGGLSINLATADNAGAMSASDKVALDALVALDVANTYATKAEVKAVSDKAIAAEESFTWGEM